ncbi:MAG: hypothetical protein ACP5DZ_07185 [Bacteroidales bacterium]
MMILNNIDHITGFETGSGSFVAQAGVEIEPCEPISSKLISSDTASNKSSSINKASLEVFPKPCGWYPPTILHTVIN